MGNGNQPILYVHRMGIDTYNQAIIFMRRDCDVCRSEGFEVPARIQVSLEDKSIIASLNVVDSHLLPPDAVGLSDFAWQILGAKEGDSVRLAHSPPLESLSFVRGKIYGKTLDINAFDQIISDIAQGLYSDTQIASFITACAGERMSIDEVLYLTQSMVKIGDKLKWHKDLIVDKHCVGGLPGNRTTMLVVPIVAAFGLTIPKTSSRAITSPAGTADTMEVLAPVQLSLEKMRSVVEKEDGCIVWGGSVTLSPADDILVRVERVLNLDNEGQLVASVLSKKIAAGSTHILIDIPIGPTAKLRSLSAAEKIRKQFAYIGDKLGLSLKIIFSDGTTPIGRGIGPALEARDVLAVLQRHRDAPTDLRERSLMLAGQVLEFSKDVLPNTGMEIAREILDSGKAWQKFQAICYAQGGLFEPKLAAFRKPIVSMHDGQVITIDNRKLSTIAKLAGAPSNKSAGIDLQVNVGSKVSGGQPLFYIHAETRGQLEYAAAAIHNLEDVITVASL